MADRYPRVRWSFAIVSVATVVFLVAPFTITGNGTRLKDRHSDPASEVPIATVAVTSEGKLFHDPRCTFIHGTPILEPARAAISQGLSPCPRCLNRELRRSPVRTSRLNP